ncbi:MAG: B12-binding domain-containing radical SAM protein, partial [Thermoguttaceae bacterium]
MHVVLWDTRKSRVYKDYAGGFGVGHFAGQGGWKGWIIRRLFTRDRRPVALLFAYLAAIFRRLGHTVEYAVEQIPENADIYVFCPSLISLGLERQAIRQTISLNPRSSVLVVGLLATVMPEAFDDLNVTVIKGEAEQLYWELEKATDQRGSAVELGNVQDLDQLPFPDWTPFNPRTFRISFDFWRFPTAMIQSSRGCLFKCDYCPYVLSDNNVRLRDPETVVAEIREDIDRWGFRSFKFRDPLFGVDRKAVYRLADLLGGLPRKIQFSLETRIELLSREMLRALKRVGLSAITVGVETPDQFRLLAFHRSAESKERQKDFFVACRELGIRTIAGFLIGFPDDTEQSIRRVARYARWLNPTFANFNVVTPYPGTKFFADHRDLIAESDFGR